MLKNKNKYLLSSIILNILMGEVYAIDFNSNDYYNLNNKEYKSNLQLLKLNNTANNNKLFPYTTSANNTYKELIDIASTTNITNPYKYEGPTEPYECDSDCTLGILNTSIEDKPDTIRIDYDGSDNKFDYTKGYFLNFTGNKFVNQAQIAIYIYDFLTDEDGKNPDPNSPVEDIINIAKLSGGSKNKHQVFENNSSISVSTVNTDDNGDSNNNGNDTNPKGGGAVINLEGDYIDIINKDLDRNSDGDIIYDNASITTYLPDQSIIVGEDVNFINITNSEGALRAGAGGDVINLTNTKPPELSGHEEILDENDTIIDYTPWKTDHKYKINNEGFGSIIESDKKGDAIKGNNLGNIEINNDRSAKIYAGGQGNNEFGEEVGHAISLEGLFILELNNKGTVASTGNNTAILLDSNNVASSAVINNEDDIIAQYADGCSSTECSTDNGKTVDESLFNNNNSYGIYAGINDLEINNKSNGTIRSYLNAIYLTSKTNTFVINNYGHIFVEDAKFDAEGTTETLNAGAAIYLSSVVGESDDHSQINVYHSSGGHSDITGSDKNGIAIELQNSANIDINIGADEDYTEDLNERSEDNDELAEDNGSSTVSGAIIATDSSTTRAGNNHDITINIGYGGKVESTIIDDTDPYYGIAIDLSIVDWSKLNMDYGAIVDGDIILGKHSKFTMGEAIKIIGDITLGDQSEVNITNDVTNSTIDGTIDVEDVEDEDNPGEMIKGDLTTNIKCTGKCSVDLVDFRNIKELNVETTENNSVAQLENSGTDPITIESINLKGQTHTEILGSYQATNFLNEGYLTISDTLKVTDEINMKAGAHTTITIGEDKNGFLDIRGVTVASLDDDHIFSLRASNDATDIVKFDTQYNFLITDEKTPLSELDNVSIVYDINSTTDSGETTYYVERKSYEDVLQEELNDNTGAANSNALEVAHFFDNIIRNDDYATFTQLINDLDNASQTAGELEDNLRSMIPEDLFGVQISRQASLSNMNDIVLNYLESTRLKTYSSRFWFNPTIGSNNYSSPDLSDIRANFIGLVGGYDIFTSSNTRLGLAGAFYNASSRTNALSSNSTLLIANPYTTFRKSSFFMDIAGNIAASFSNYNRSVSFSTFTFKADYKNIDSSFALKTGYVLGSLKGFNIIPNIKYISTNISGSNYKEYGRSDDFKPGDKYNIFKANTDGYLTDVLKIGISAGKMKQTSRTRVYGSIYGYYGYNFSNTTLNEETALIDQESGESLHVKHIDIARNQINFGGYIAIQDRNISYSLSYDMNLGKNYYNSGFSTKVYYKFD